MGRIAVALFAITSAINACPPMPYGLTLPTPVMTARHEDVCEDPGIMALALLWIGVMLAVSTACVPQLSNQLTPLILVGL